VTPLSTNHVYNFDIPEFTLWQGLVFNATFNNISVILWRTVFFFGGRNQEKNIVLSQVTDKHYDIMKWFCLQSKFLKKYSWLWSHICCIHLPNNDGVLFTLILFIYLSHYIFNGQFRHTNRPQMILPIVKNKINKY
jgi:hypothetical protein